MCDECWAKDAHETRQYQQVRRKPVQLCNNRVIERLAVRKIGMLNASRRNTRLFCAYESVGIRVIAKDDRQFEFKLAILNGVDKRL